MKIPIYQRQTTLTRDSGARPLSAMASPGAYAQPANAAFQLGQAISGVGDMVGDIAIAEEKQENATLQAAETSKFSDTIHSIQTDALTSPVGQSSVVINPRTPAGPGPRIGNQIMGPGETQQQHLARYRTQMQNQIKSQAARISDKDVRRRFVADANIKMRAALPGIQTQLRTRYLDRHRATMDENINKPRRALSRHDPNSKIYQHIVDQTVGQIVADGNANGETQVQIRKKVRTFKSDLVEDRVLDLLQSLSPEQADEALKLSRELENYASPNSPYRDLLPDRQERLSRKALNQYQMDSLRAQREAERKEKRDERAAEKQGEENKEKYLRRMSRYREAQNEGKTATDDDGNLITMPSQTEIELDRTLTDQQRRVLIGARLGTDRINNPAAVASFNNAILSAVADQDLETIRREIVAAHSAGTIGQQARDDLIGSITATKNKTPEALERQRYKTYVERALNLKAIDVFGSTAPGTLYIDKADATLQFQAYMQGGMRPAEAAFRVVADFVGEAEDGLKSLAGGLPPNIRKEIISKRGAEGELSDDIRGGIQKLRNYYKSQLDGLKLPDVAGKTQEQLFEEQRKNLITRSQRLTVRQLFALESRINAIESLYNRMENSVKTDPPTGSESERNFFQRYIQDPIARQFETNQAPTADR